MDRYVSQEAVREAALVSLEADAAYEHGRAAVELKVQQTADAAYKRAVKRNRDCAAGPEAESATGRPAVTIDIDVSTYSKLCMLYTCHGLTI